MHKRRHVLTAWRDDSVALRKSLLAATLVALAIIAGGLVLAAHGDQGQIPSVSAAKGPAIPSREGLPSVAHGLSQGPAASPSEGLPTTITLLPAGASIPISSLSNGTNVFQVTYVANGTTHTAYVGSSPLTLAADPGTNLTVSGVSRYNLSDIFPGEEWLLDSGGAPVNVASGSSVTLYYYNLLEESAYYSVANGGSPPAPTLTYVSAPPIPSSTGLPYTSSVMLPAAPQELWFLTGTTASVTNPASANATVRWETKVSSWTLTEPFQTPMPIKYFHQYYVTLQYTVTGGGIGFSSPTAVCPIFGGSYSVTVGTPVWIDAGAGDYISNCAYSPLLPGSSQTQQWAAISGSVQIMGPGILTLNYQLQYPLTISWNIVGQFPISPPAVTSTFFQEVSTISLPDDVSVIWVDAGSSYSVSNPTPLSNSNERWITTNDTIGLVGQATTISVVYYQQFLISASYTVVGGGAPPAPSFSYVNFGSSKSLNLTGTPQALWVDGETNYQAPSLLAGSNSNERWYSPGTSGVANESIVLALVYHHQYYLTIIGGGASSQWEDANSTADVVISGVFGRSAGQGQRVVSYSIDAQSPVPITPTIGNVSILVPMQGSHLLTIASVGQYQLLIDNATLAAVASITPPTIPADNFWYDSGTNVAVVLNGAWGRTNGTGLRLVSYVLDGGPVTPENTTSRVTALSIGSMSSPQSLTATTVVQYYLTISTGSLLSITPPPIAGDTGWYDSGTILTAAFDYSWNIVGNQSRLNAIGYNVTGLPETSLNRSGSGMFSFPLAVSGPITIGVDFVTQYHLGISGGAGAGTSVLSPTGDAYFDAGTELRVTTPATWGEVNGTTRRGLVSFSIDGRSTNVTQAAQGSFETPAITMNSAHQVSFSSISQYLITFRFTDSTGTFSFTPQSADLILNGAREALNLPRSWFDTGSDLNVTTVDWEGAELQPMGSSGLRVTTSTTLDVRTSLYETTLKVTDLLGLPISGSEVSITFENKTSTIVTTGGNGVADLGLLPQGTYHLSVSGLAGSTEVTMNPAVNSQEVVDVTFSYVTITIMVVAVLLVAAVVVLVIIRRPRHA